MFLTTHARIPVRLLLLLGCLQPDSMAQEACDALGTTWPSGEIEYRVGEPFPAEAGSRAHQETIIRCGVDAWSKQTRAGIQASFGGRTDQPSVLGDGVNTISWTGSDGGDAFAATVWEGEGDVTTEFDILFFSSVGAGETPIRWTTNGRPASLETDVQGVLVHEFGHALGLGHFTDPTATMFPSIRARGLALRTLAASDIACIEALYGADGPEPSVALSSVEPDSSGEEGGGTVVINGENFTYADDTEIRFGDVSVEAGDISIDSCDRLIVHRVPSHEPGRVDVRIANHIGSRVLKDGFEFTPTYARFIRADANGDGSLDLSDGIEMLSSLFLGTGPLGCAASGDSNGDGILDLSDAVHVLSHLFLGGEAPPSPSSCTETNPTEPLSCETFPACT